jgi:hypothetical protein
MKKILKAGVTLLLIVSAILCHGCKKGSDGEPGKDGSANVTSTTYSITSWTNGSNYWYKQLSVPELTSSNINSASVQVYWGTVSNNWIAVPYTYVASTNYFMNYLTTVNLVEVRWTYNGIGNGNSPNTELNGGSPVQIKVVVIPPALKKANPDVDLNDYKAVKSRFGL